MDFPSDLLSKLDITNLLAMSALLWFFYSRIDKKFDKVDQRFEKIDQRFDKLDEKVTDIDRRLCRLEGAFTAKECCVIKEDRHQKMAE